MENTMESIICVMILTVRTWFNKGKKDRKKVKTNTQVVPDGPEKQFESYSDIPKFVLKKTVKEKAGEITRLPSIMPPLVLSSNHLEESYSFHLFL